MNDFLSGVMVHEIYQSSATIDSQVVDYMWVREIAVAITIFYGEIINK